QSALVGGPRAAPPAGGGPAAPATGGAASPPVAGAATAPPPTTAAPAPVSAVVFGDSVSVTLARAHPQVAIVLLGRWELLDRVLNGTWQHVGQPAFDTYLAQQLDAAITTA